jgi:hypothetical protein
MANENALEHFTQLVVLVLLDLQNMSNTMVTASLDSVFLKKKGGAFLIFSLHPQLPSSWTGSPSFRCVLENLLSNRVGGIQKYMLYLTSERSK